MTNSTFPRAALAWRAGGAIRAASKGERRCLRMIAVLAGLVFLMSTPALGACTDRPAPNVDYSRCDLVGADLSWANLIIANLFEANLRNANLSNADLVGADLSNANLNGADLSGADLSWANLSNANLNGVNLSSAFLINVVGAAISVPADITRFIPRGDPPPTVTYSASATLGQTDVSAITGLTLTLTRPSGSTFPVGGTTVVARLQDFFGNTIAQDSFTVTVAEQASTSPTVTLGALTATGSGSYSSAITLSEAAGNGTAFELSDLDLTNATATLTGSGTSFTATLTPLADGTIGLAIPAGAFTDGAGNDSEAAAQITAEHDSTAPTATISPLSGPSNGVYTATITLSEASTDFTVDDLVLGNADAGLAGGGTLYTVTLTPRSAGPISVFVAANSFSDAAGNFNTVPSVTRNVTVTASTAPNVQITGLPESFMAQPVLSATITFSEPVTGFDIGELQLGNATALSLSGSGASYLAQIRPTGGGDVTLQVPANAAQNAAGAGNQASAVASTRNETTEETQRQVVQFMTGRASQLASNQPSLSCHLQQSCAGVSGQAQVTRRELSFAYTTRPENPVWIQLGGARTHDGSATSDYVFGAFGSHGLINEHTLIGVLFEFDHVAQSDGASSIEGTGWLVGPYFVTRLPNQPLYLEGRLLAGMSENRIQPFGTYTDRFETRRLLAQLGLSGRLVYGDVTLTPSLAGIYVTDTQLAYTDSLGNLIPEQGVELGQVELGLGFEMPATLFGQYWILGGGLTAIYATTSQTGAAQALASNNDGTRARVALSGSTEFDNGAPLNIGASYDGIGVDGFEAISFEIGFLWNF